MMRASGFALTLSFAVSSSVSAGSEVIPLPAPGTGPWKPLHFRSVPAATIYTPMTVEGTAAVRAESECSASALLLPLVEFDLARTPVLVWRWRIERGLAIREERTRGGDDFAARVYVLFRFDPQRATLGQRLRHRLGQVLYGEEPPGRALNFVWASRATIGAHWDSPFEASSKMIVQATGPSGDWREEAVDVASWYRALFGGSPPPLLGIALMSDSDNSCQKATATFANFRFRSRSG